MGREELVELAALLRARLLLHLLQAAERERHGPRILLGTLQKFVAVVVRLALLLLRIGRLHERLAQIAQLRLGQRRGRTALRCHAVLQRRGQQRRAEGLLRIAVGDVSHLVTDDAQQLFVAHDVHQGREDADAAVGTGEGIHVDHVVDLEIELDALGVGQPLGQLLQADRIGVVIGADGVVGIHPVDVLLDVGRHLLVGQRHGLHGLRCTAEGLFQIELRHGRRRADQARKQGQTPCKEGFLHTL